MDQLPDWLGQYLAPLALLLVLGTALIYVLQRVFKHAVPAAFNSISKHTQPPLERRARFEEKMLPALNDELCAEMNQTFGIDAFSWNWPGGVPQSRWAKRVPRARCVRVRYRRAARFGPWGTLLPTAPTGKIALEVHTRKGFTSGSNRLLPALPAPPPR